MKEVNTAQWDDVIIKALLLLLPEAKITGLTCIGRFNDNGLFLASLVNWWDPGLEMGNVRTAAERR